MLPDSDARLKLSILNLETYGNLLPFLEKPFYVEIHARNCIMGEMLTAERTCIPCPAGYYSVETNFNQPSICKPCPEHAICLGGADMTP